MAIKAHGNQLYGDKPYSVHLDEVAGLVQPYGWDYVKLAYCHDLLEDVPDSEEDHRLWEDRILERTDQQFLDDCLLLKDEDGVNRKERKAKTYAKMREAGPEFERALVVKQADRLGNVRSSVRDNPKKLKMYQKEHPAFQGAVYSVGVANELMKELDELLELPSSDLEP
jgi:(p)ppGpp synthase/HD superfamily hydrolase